jgi:hypothetical protein
VATRAQRKIFALLTADLTTRQHTELDQTSRTVDLVCAHSLAFAEKSTPAWALTRSIGLARTTAL